jgi:hypothetical protein
LRKWLLERIKLWLEAKPKEAPEITELRARVDKLEKRNEEIAKHFVIQFDPVTRQPMTTLADKYADEDNKPRPGTTRRSGASWDQRKRFLEARDAAPKAKVTN